MSIHRMLTGVRRALSEPQHGFVVWRPRAAGTFRSSCFVATRHVNDGFGMPTDCGARTDLPSARAASTCDLRFAMSSAQLCSSSR